MGVLDCYAVGGSDDDDSRSIQTIIPNELERVEEDRNRMVGQGYQHQEEDGEERK